MDYIHLSMWRRVEEGVPQAYYGILIVKWMEWILTVKVNILCQKSPGMPTDPPPLSFTLTGALSQVDFFQSCSSSLFVLVVKVEVSHSCTDYSHCCMSVVTCCAHCYVLFLSFPPVCDLLDLYLHIAHDKGKAQDMHGPPYRLFLVLGQYHRL